MRAVLEAAGEPAEKRAPSTSLSQREQEVLRLLARGETMNDVASRLTIAYKTVDRHVQNIYAKAGVSTRAGATLWAIEHGLA